MLRLLPAVLGVLAVAHPAGFVAIRAGDQVRIAGSSTRCLVEEAGIFCTRFRGGKLAPGDYGTLAIAGGIAVEAYRITDGIHTQTVFRKWPKGLPSIPVLFDLSDVTRTVTLRVGQVARLRIQTVNLDCAIVRAGARNVPTAYCATDDKIGPVPKTYATLASDDGVAIGVIGRTRRTTIVYTHRQP